uniref:Cilia- and flagella-associated protein 36 n=1 Tax=Macrostomum lignano TaxID=282301 RepID=A0A1I8JJ25_9PLAT
MTQPTIFDHLISYLEHPFFQIPVISFCEQKCICFNPGTEDCPEYKRIHKEYIEVLTAILDAFREDMKLSHDQVIKAVQDIDSVQSDFREYFRGIEQVLAIESYPLFVRMMQRCNIELQEQALLLILQRQGVQTPAGQPNLQSEDEILAMVLRQSKQEFEREEAARRRRTQQRSDASSSSGRPDDFYLPSGVGSAAAAASGSGGSRGSRGGAGDREDRHKPAPGADKRGKAASELAESLSSLSHEEILKRQEFLRNQRDKLVAMKQREREAQLAKHERSAGRDRPSSARAARSAMSGRPEDSGPPKRSADDERKLAMRRAIAAKLKEEVIDSNTTAI